MSHSSDRRSRVDHRRVVAVVVELVLGHDQVGVVGAPRVAQDDLAVVGEALDVVLVVAVVGVFEALRWVAAVHADHDRVAVLVVLADVVDVLVVADAEEAPGVVGAAGVVAGHQLGVVGAPAAFGAAVAVLAVGAVGRGQRERLLVVRRPVGVVRVVVVAHAREHRVAVVVDRELVGHRDDVRVAVAVVHRHRDGAVGVLPDVVGHPVGVLLSEGAHLGLHPAVAYGALVDIGGRGNAVGAEQSA